MKRFVLAALVAAAASQAVAGPVLGISSHLTASPNMARGACPQVITLAGTVTVHVAPGAAPQIGVQFLRSDGAIAPISYFNATGPVTNHPVSTTWTLGGSSLPTYVGWEQVKVWPTQGGFPVTLSNKALFKLDCAVRREPPAPRP